MAETTSNDLAFNLHRTLEKQKKCVKDGAYYCYCAYVLRITEGAALNLRETDYSGTK